MTPDWLKEIEQSVLKEMPDQFFQHGLEDCYRLISALKIAIHGLEFYSSTKMLLAPKYLREIKTDVFLKETDAVSNEFGTKAREILEKIKRGEI